MVTGSDSPVRSTRYRGPAALLLCLTAGLAAFGLVVLMSAGKSFPNRGHDPHFIFKRQALWLVPALVSGVGASLVNLDRIRAHVGKLYSAACALLIIARVPGIGRNVNGSWRWLEFGPVKLQVSDLGKIALVLTLAHYLAGHRRWFSFPRPRLISWDFSGWLSWRFWRSWPAIIMPLGVLLWLGWLPLWPLRFLRPTAYAWRCRTFRRDLRLMYPIPNDDAAGDFVNGFVKPCLLIGGICALVMIEPDLGTTVLCAGVGGVLLFVVGVRHLYVWPLVTTAASAFAMLVINWPNRLNRVLAFIDPEGHQADIGYQLWQGMLGFGVGGVNGAGLGRGIQQQAFLPEAHTDFVFAIVGEELGLAFTMGVMLAFLGVFWVVATSLRRQQDVFRFNVCLGSALFIVLQSLINMGVVTGCLPTKGMSLPFISYGGTNLVMMFTFVGLIINCMRTGSRILPSGPSEIS